MKRKLALTGAIMSGVTLLVFAVIMIRGIIIIAQTGTEQQINALGYSVIVTIVMVATMVFDFVSIPFFKTDEKMMSKKWIISVALFGNSFVTCTTAYDLFSADGVILVVMLIFALLLAAATILIALDFSKARQEVEKVSVMGDTNAEESKVRLEGKKDADEIIEENTSLEKRLAKLNELKEKGLLNEEEYNIYRQQIINKELDK